MPKFKIRRKRNERIKMTFIVDECKGSLRGWGRAGKRRQGFEMGGVGGFTQQCRGRPRVTAHGTLNTAHNAAILPK